MGISPIRIGGIGIRVFWPVFDRDTFGGVRTDPSFV